MKIIAQILSVGVSVSLAGCSAQEECAPQYVWLTASSLAAPNVQIMENQIVTARETVAGTWIWQWQGAAAQTLSVEQLLSRVAEARTLRPDPLILFSFARHPFPDLIELRARIARSAGCTSPDRPCFEGTPEQLE